eukprot:IDg16621t1
MYDFTVFCHLAQSTHEIFYTINTALLSLLASDRLLYDQAAGTKILVLNVVCCAGQAENYSAFRLELRSPCSNASKIIKVTMFSKKREELLKQRIVVQGAELELQSQHKPLRLIRTEKLLRLTTLSLKSKNSSIACTSAGDSNTVRGL